MIPPSVGGGMSAGAYRELLTTAPGNAFDADSDTPDLRRLYTPDSHRLALDPGVTVVRGGRGSGKTVWFKVLSDDRLRKIAAEAYKLPRLNSVITANGFGTAVGPNSYPGPATIRRILNSEVEPADIWTAVILVALNVEQIAMIQGWENKAVWARNNPEAYEEALWKADQQASADHVIQLLLFDGLDHLHSDRTVADQMVSGLLKAALGLRLATRNIRAKVFIRPDMYESASRNFADASKLGANAADLTWSTENLYGLLFHQLGNGERESAVDFRRVTGSWRAEQSERFVPPADVVADSKRQEEIFVDMAGWYMGANHRKGYTYTWLPNHLQDGNWQVSPRSFLRAVSKAAEVTRDSFASYELALHHDAIRQGVQAASQVRVDEIKEDIPWAAVAGGMLRGQQVPIDATTVVECWREGALATQLRALHADGSVGSGPKDMEDYDGLIQQLVELGVMTWRTTGKLDLPDVYRIAFDIGRKGGVRRPVR
ncbi:hypothetical protein [Kitasatospora griseola]|uniref:hypothetical protein n=1 Tax=Kitasatospora griseola TaxID=2064 RepID=UPI003433E221